MPRVVSECPDNINADINLQLGHEPVEMVNDPYAIVPQTFRVILLAGEYVGDA